MLFSLLVLAWMPIDYNLLPAEVVTEFTWLRLVSAGIFLILALSVTRDNDTSYARTRLVVMMLIPSLFYALSHYFNRGLEVEGAAEVLVGMYEFLPFIIMAGLALFPLTVIEVLVLGGSLLFLMSISTAYTFQQLPSYYISATWMLVLILAADMLSAAIQLKYMSSLMNRISQDTLTGAITRQAGEELIDLHFELALEEDTPFAIAFVDLDNFKSINDIYGHEAGDAALIEAVTSLKKVLRRGDKVVRWGGEEFLLVLLDSDIEGVSLILDRIQKQWLGTRPDGDDLTASMGVAERINDATKDWTVLIELADQRMYQAKQAGKAQAVYS